MLSYIFLHKAKKAPQGEVQVQQKLSPTASQALSNPLLFLANFHSCYWLVLAMVTVIKFRAL